MSYPQEVEKVESYLLSIDIGTSSCKVVIFDTDGREIASTNQLYKVYYPAEGFAEQNPDEWWQATCNAIKEALEVSKVNPSSIAGIGVDGQSWSAIAIGKDGQVLTNTPIWMDTRAKDICDRVNKEIGQDKIFDLCGNSFQPSYTTPKILWYKENMPEVYKNTSRILQSNSFIVYKLTGNISQDMSQGYGYHCFDTDKGIWDYDMAKEMGINSSFLPEIYACHDVVGTVSGETSKLTGLLEGTPVVAGGLDAACGALGVGVLESGQTQEQGGQAGGMSICIDEYKSHKALILGFHVVPDLWLLQGGTVGGGGVMKWFEEEFADYERSQSEHLHKSSLDQLNDIANQVSPGSDGLVFLPYMMGERSPIWDPNAKGVYYGLDFSKTKGHMVRASMEGVAFSLMHNLEIAKGIGVETNELRAMGGAANSKLWTQIKSDITGKEIKVPSSDTATAMGAAILAGVGVGVYKDFNDAVSRLIKIKRKHSPNMENHKTYMKNYELYLELYDNLKGLMRKYGGN